MMNLEKTLVLIMVTGIVASIILSLIQSVESGLFERKIDDPTIIKLR
jgi:hypothetical protein